MEGNGGRLGRGVGLGLWWVGPAGVGGKELTVRVAVFHFLVRVHLRGLVVVVVVVVVPLELVGTDVVVVDVADIVFVAVVVPLELVAATDIIAVADVVVVVVDIVVAVDTVVVVDIVAVVDTVVVVVVISHSHESHAALQKAGLHPLMHSPCLERQQTAGGSPAAEKDGYQLEWAVVETASQRRPSAVRATNEKDEGEVERCPSEKQSAWYQLREVVAQ